MVTPDLSEERLEELELLIEAEGWQLVHQSPELYRAERAAGSLQRSEAAVSLPGLLRAVRLTEARLRGEEAETEAPTVPVTTGLVPKDT